MKSAHGTPLNDRIRHFYDSSTAIWLNTWGEHMHHGFYGHTGTAQKDHKQAQLDLVDELLQWGGPDKAQVILDAGCGVGGSARILARTYGAQVLGLTLSPVQAEQSVQYTKKAGLSGHVRVRVQDVMSVNHSDGPFDLVWSLESAEHIPDKQKLLKCFFRCAKAGRQVTPGHLVPPGYAAGIDRKGTTAAAKNIQTLSPATDDLYCGIPANGVGCRLPGSTNG
jgi:tocopherol O-methyltransferase